MEKIKVGDKVDIIDSPEYGVVEMVNYQSEVALVRFTIPKDTPSCSRCSSPLFLTTLDSGEIFCNRCGKSHGFETMEKPYPISALKKVEK